MSTATADRCMTDADARKLVAAATARGDLVDLLWVAAHGYRDPRPYVRENASRVWDLAVAILYRRDPELVQDAGAFAFGE